MRTIIIGDIHGCFQELTILLKKVELDEDMDRLISLGDLIDRGEHSYEVFDLFRSLKLRLKERCVLIRGNHEQMMLDSQTDPDSRLSWQSNGGGNTVKSFRRHKDDICRHTGWFQDNMVLYHEDPHFQCTHAGLGKGPIAQNAPETLLWDRDSIRQNSYDGKLTIIGHTPITTPAHFFGDGQNVMLLPYRRKMPLPQKGLICLDTGCVFQGRLTAMVIEKRQFWLEAVDWGEAMPEDGTMQKTADAAAKGAAAQKQAAAKDLPKDARPSWIKGLTGLLQRSFPPKNGR